MSLNSLRRLPGRMLLALGAVALLASFAGCSGGAAAEEQASRASIGPIPAGGPPGPPAGIGPQPGQTIKPPSKGATK